MSITMVFHHTAETCPVGWDGNPQFVRIYTDPDEGDTVMDYDPIVSGGMGWTESNGGTSVEETAAWFEAKGFVMQ